MKALINHGDGSYHASKVFAVVNDKIDNKWDAGYGFRYLVFDENNKLYFQDKYANIQKNIDSNIEKLRMNLTNETAQLAINKAKNHIENELKKDRTLHIRYINESIDALKEIDL